MTSNQNFWDLKSSSDLIILTSGEALFKVNFQLLINVSRATYTTPIREEN